jgi:sulfoxide reductase heme-binding subunit YedZ
LDTDLPAGHALGHAAAQGDVNQLWLIRFRRMFGLFSFFYVTLHFLTYICLEKFFDIHEMLADIAKRKFITVGFTGFVLLIPLAITSTSGWIRRLGVHRWNRLHQLIYLAAIASVIHYYWLVKADVRKPLQYAAVLSLLLGYRLAISVFRNSTQTTTPDSRARACESLS